MIIVVNDFIQGSNTISSAVENQLKQIKKLQLKLITIFGYKVLHVISLMNQRVRTRKNNTSMHVF